MNTYMAAFLGQFIKQQVCGLRTHTCPLDAPLQTPAVFAALLGCLFWGCAALCMAFRRRRGEPAAATLGPSDPITWTHYQARIVMTLGVAMFYLYPTVSVAAGPLRAHA